MELYVVRFTNQGLPKISKPCIHCQQYCIKYGIRKVHYFNHLGEWETIKL